MAAVKYDVEDVESGGGGEEPQPGSYPGKIVSVVHRKKKAQGNEVISDFEIVCDIGKEYVRLWTYVKLPDDPNWSKESHGWKLRELTDALGLPPKGSIDPAKITKQQPAVLVKITSDTHRDSGEYRGKIKNLFPIGDNKTPADEAGEPAADGEGPFERTEMETWTDEDIRGYAEEIGVDNITGRGWKPKLLDAIVEKQDEGAEPEAGEEPEAATGPALDGVSEDVLAELKPDADYYGEWSDDDIKWMVEGLGIEGNVPTSGRGWKPKAIAAIVELAEGGGGEAPADGEEEPDDYDDVDDAGNPVWPDEDLAGEIVTRNETGAEIKISGRKTREKMIEALREDNKNATPF